MVLERRFNPEVIYMDRSPYEAAELEIARLYEELQSAYNAQRPARISMHNNKGVQEALCFMLSMAKLSMATYYPEPKKPKAKPKLAK